MNSSKDTQLIPREKRFTVQINSLGRMNLELFLPDGELFLGTWKASGQSVHCKMDMDQLNYFIRKNRCRVTGEKQIIKHQEVYGMIVESLL